MFATYKVLLHPSVATGMMGFMFFIYAIPVLSMAFVVWAVATRNVTAGGLRYASMAGAIVLACAGWALARTDGMTGGAASQFAWRWSPTAEDRLLAKASEPPAPVPGAAPATPAVQPSTPQAAAEAPVTAAPVVGAVETGADWPGFRGPHRDSIVPGVRIRTDWAASPPAELWRRPIGPGWSSFAVRGGLVYTQEQRGEDELVACYRLSTGQPVWTHRDPARFWESNAGAGPRGTPTLSNGRIYTFGATGILNALDAATGKKVWSRNAASDTRTKVPGWGFSSSPVVVDDIVVIATSGRLSAYSAATGEPRWMGPDDHGGGYSSPHLTTIGDVTQILMMSQAGLISVAPADGKLLWEHKWPAGTRIVQPAVSPDGDVLLSGADGDGIRRLKVAHASSGWTVEERWMSAGLKPYFNDFVIHKEHAFGFDGRILSCIDLKDGVRKWKGGRYGNGQMVLLADQDLLLVLSEEGELVLVGATPDQFREIAKLPAIEGKTWNHPVLAGDVLLVRNGQEMAAFRLTLASR